MKNEKILTILINWLLAIFVFTIAPLYALDSNLLLIFYIFHIYLFTVAIPILAYVHWKKGEKKHARHNSGIVETA